MYAFVERFLTQAPAESTVADTPWCTSYDGHQRAGSEYVRSWSVLTTKSDSESFGLQASDNLTSLALNSNNMQFSSLRAKPNHRFVSQPNATLAYSLCHFEFKRGLSEGMS